MWLSRQWQAADRVPENIVPRDVDYSGFSRIWESYVDAVQTADEDGDEEVPPLSLFPLGDDAHADPEIENIGGPQMARLS